MSKTTIDAAKRLPLSAVGMLGCVFAAPAAAQDAQPFPAKPIRFLIGTAPGAGVDTTARAIGIKLTQAWGQQVVVDARPGASGAFAYEQLMKATPDGHTIMMISATHPISSLVIPDWPYPVDRAVQPVSQVTSLFYIVYHHPSVPFGSFKDMIAYARANPGKLRYGTGGNSSISHLAWEMIAHDTGVKLMHVAYKGAQPAITATAAGEMHVGMATLISLRAHMQAGRSKPLAITARQRSSTLPEVPTVAELGLPGYEVDQWYGVATSVKAPPAAVRRLHAGVVAAIRSPDVMQRLAADGSTAVGSTPEEFAVHIKAELAKWRKVLADTGLALSASKLRAP
jgi:tripartite-type tricarboxylate transporter receptor subunit TctC